MDPHDREWFDAVRRGHPPGAFGHREHLRLAWLALDHSGGVAGAQQQVGETVRALATAAGVPQKYNRTVTDAWVLIVAHCRARAPGADFEAVLRSYPLLTDKRTLARHYTSRTLASAAARQQWVEPDLLPIPGS